MPPVSDDDVTKSFDNLRMCLGNSFEMDSINNTATLTGLVLRTVFVYADTLSLPNLARATTRRDDLRTYLANSFDTDSVREATTSVLDAFVAYTGALSLIDLARATTHMNTSELALRVIIQRWTNDDNYNIRSMTCLSFIGKKLTMLPTTIVALIYLTELNVFGNLLRTLPAEIRLLSSLSILIVSFNQLSSLPREIGELRSLTRMEARGNELSSLPIEICKLHMLRTLDVADNKITSLPREINQLEKLCNMFVHNNLLRALPLRSIDALVNLTYFTFVLNPFNDMPRLHYRFIDFPVRQQYRTASVSLGATLLALIASCESLYLFALPVCERVLRPLVDPLVSDDDLLQCIYSMHVSCQRVFSARA